MQSSADDCKPCDPDVALISTELELPVITADGSAPLPEVFAAAWADLIERGWTAGDFCVTRPQPGDRLTISSCHLISTDTGPVIELVTAPSATLTAIASQLTAILAEACAALEGRGCRMLASGIHPAVRPTPADYYRYRTPRPTYDYAIQQRGWRHWSILDKAAVQEVVDVPFADAPRALRALHRLAGLMNFLLRNDPGVHARDETRLSVRPLAWRSHVPHTGPFAGDARKVGMPRTEIESWQDYLALLWDTSPMFLVGTKNDGHVFVPEHPTFLDFLKRAPRDGWDARRLDGTPARVGAETAHVAATDWSYMGPARLRWKWRADAPGLAEPADIVEAWERGRIEELMAGCLEKVVIENRCNSTQPPGDELVSLALVSGLLANLEETIAFTSAAPYAFWVRLLDDSTRLPLRSSVLGRSVPDLARELVAIARGGLARRGEAAANRWLAPLDQRIEDGLSPSEHRLRELADGGIPALIRRTVL